MKTNFTRFLMLVVAVATTSVLTAREVAFEEDFSTNALPTGWTQTGTVWTFADEAALLKSDQMVADTLITPLFSLDKISIAPLITIDYVLPPYANTGLTDELKVLYRYSASGEWKMAGAIEEPTAVLRRAQLPLTVTTESNMQLAVVGNSQAAGGVKISYISLGNSSACGVAPEFSSTTEITGRDARLNWYPSTVSEFDFYRLKVATGEIASPDITDGDVVANLEWDLNTYSFSENGKVLEPNTTYYVYLQAVCEGNDGSPWSSLQFTTLCEPIDMGYTEGFEDELSHCYVVLNQNNIESDEIGLSGAYRREGNSAFAFVVSKNNFGYLYLPEGKSDWSKYQLSFWMATDADGVGRTLTVGYDDAADGVGFTPFYTLTLPVARKWEKVTISLKGAAGHKFVAFRVGDENKANTIYIDDLSLEVLDDCLRPLFLRTSALTSTTVSLQWDEVNGAETWSVIVSPTLLTAEQLEDGDFDESLLHDVNTNPATITGLTANTRYYAYVKSPCNSADLWSEPLEFTTLKSVKVPFEEHFDLFAIDFYTNDTTAVPEGWVSGVRGRHNDYTNEFENRLLPDLHKTDKAYVVSGKSAYQNHQVTPYTKAALRIGGSTHGSTPDHSYYSGYAIMPEAEQAVNTMQLTFWAYGPANVPIVVAVSTTNQPSKAGESTTTGEPWINDAALYTEIKQCVLPQSDTWSQFRVSLKDYVGTGKYIVFRTGDATTTPIVYIDDITLENIPDCQEVLNLKTEGTGTTSIKATWQDEQNRAWNVRVSTTDAGDGDIYSGSVTETQFLYTNADNLSMGSTYYISVSPDCGDAWTTQAVTTLVGIELPYAEDFISYPSGKYTLTEYYPETWKHGNAGNGGSKADGTGTLANYEKAGYIYKNSAAGVTIVDTIYERGLIDELHHTPNKNRLVLYATNGSTDANKLTKPYVILPQILDDVAMSDINISFWAINACTSKTSLAGSLPSSTPYGSNYQYKIIPTTIKLYAAPDMSGNTANWELLNTTTLSSMGVPEYISVSPTYTGNDKKYLVIMQDAVNLQATNTTMGVVFIDYLKISNKSKTLLRPTNLKMASVSETGGTLSWLENGSATKWNVRVYTCAQHDPATGSNPYLHYLAPETPAFSADNVGSQSVSLTGLKEGVRYFVYVQATDGTNAGEWSVPYIFYTSLTKAKVPFYDKFDGHVIGQGSKDGFVPTTGLPDYYLPILNVPNSTTRQTRNCGKYDWTNLQVRRTGTSTGSTYWYRDYEQNYTNYTALSLPIDTMAKYLYMKAAGAAEAVTAETDLTTLKKDTNMVMLVLPPMDADLNKLRLEFYAGNNYAYSTTSTSTMPYAAMGYYSQSSDKFVKVADGWNTTGAKTWDLFRCDFDTVDMATLPSDARIAIRLCPAEWKQYAGYTKSSSINLELYLDNLSVTYIPVCKQVEKPVLKAVTQKTAEVQWQPADTEKKWEITVSTTAIKPDNGDRGNIVSSETLTDPTATLTGLTPNTDYYVYVRSIDEEKDCEGQWSPALVFTTLCTATTLPYEEDFTSCTVSNDSNRKWPSSCMRQAGEDFPTTLWAYVKKVTTINAAGDTILCLTQTKDKQFYFVFPELEVENIKNTAVTLTMQVPAGPTNETATYDQRNWTLGVMTDPLNTETFVAIKSDSVVQETIGGTTYWEDHSYSLEDYAGYHGQYGKYVAIRLDNGKQKKGGEVVTEKASILWINKIVIQKTITCFTPTLFTSQSVGVTSASFSWATTNESATQRLRLFTTEVSNPAAAVPAFEKTVVGTAAEINGLAGNKTYYAYLRTECATDEQTEWVGPLKIHTECPEAQPLPYEEDFDGFEVGLTPNCWTNVGGSFEVYGANKTQYVNAVVRNGALTLESGVNNDKSAVAYAVTPKLAIDDLSKLVVYFQARTSGSESNTLTISALGEASSEKQVSKRVVITQTPLQITGSNKLFYLDFSTLTENLTVEELTTYKYLRFEIANRRSNTGVLIDDLVITTDHTPLDIANLTLNQYGDTYACISFSDPMEGNSWEVSYGAAGFTAGEGTQLTVASTMDTLTSLTPGTDYDIYVRSIGGRWVGPLPVTTIPAGAASIPYATGFEEQEERDAWTLVRVKWSTLSRPEIFSLNNFVFGDAANCGGTGDKALYITDNEEDYHYSYVSGDHGYAWAYRYVNFPKSGTYKVSARAKSPGNNTSDYLAGGIIPASSILETDKAKRYPNGGAISYISENGTDNFPIFYAAGGYNYANAAVSQLSGKSEWDTYTNVFNVKQPGTYMIVLQWYNGWSGSTIMQPGAVDSIRIEEYPCTEIEDLTLTSVTGNTASFTWYGGQCKNFEVIVATLKNSGIPEALDDAYVVKKETISTGASYSVDGLEPNSSYAFYVRTVCEDGYTEWKELDFTTICESEALPYVEKFAVKPGCWTYSSASAEKTSMQYKTASDAVPQTWNTLYLPKNAIAVLPLMELPLSQLQIRVSAFAGKDADYGTLQVGVVNSTTDLSSFQPLGYLTSAKYADSRYDLQTAVVNLNNYTGKGQFLALKGSDETVMYIKEVQVNELPSCIAPIDVTVGRITTNSARVSWRPQQNETAWVLMVNGTEMRVTENPYVLTDLSQGTDYSLTVRAICSDTDESEESLPVQFTTACSISSLPILADFNDQNPLSLIDITCWENLISTSRYSEQFEDADIVADELSEPANYQEGWFTANNSYLSHISGYSGKAALSIDKKSGNGLNHRWLITPVIEMPNGINTLQFDYAYGSSQDGLTAEMLTDDDGNFDAGRFLVLISQDAGATWLTADTTQIDLLAATNQMTTKTIDLKAYNEKNIRIAFYHESGYAHTGDWPYLFIDNVKILGGSIVEDEVCAGSDYTDNGFNIPASGLRPNKTQEFTRTDENGNTVLLRLTVEKIPYAEDNATICAGDYYDSSNGYQYSAASTFYEYKQEANGCLTRKHVTLSVAPVHNETIKATICQGESYEFNGNTKIYREAGEFTEVADLKSKFGCDSVTTLILTVNPVYNIALTDKICQGGEYEFNGVKKTYNESGVFTEVANLTTKAGCDSIVTLTLTVSSAYEYDLPVFICSGEEYEFDGKVFNENTTYTGHFTTVNGCDSIVTLRLEVGEQKIEHIYQTICAGGSFPFNGQNYDATGVYEYVTKSQRVGYEGCDSTAVLHLTVVDNYDYELTAQICQGGEYKFNGETKTYSEAGVFTERAELKSQFGCDSIVTLQLTVNPVYNLTIEETVCQNTEYVFNQNSIPTNVPGVLTRVAELQSAAGCDSTVTLNLTVLPAYNQERVISICEGNSYPFHDVDYAESGTYTWSGQTELGCDSVETLILSVTPVEKEERVFTVKDSQLPFEDEYIRIPEGYSGVFTQQVWLSDITCEVIEYTVTISPTPTALDNLSEASVAVYPSPAERDGVVYLTTNLTSAQQEGMTVELFSYTGARIASYTAEQVRHGIAAPATAGMYAVVLTTTQGEKLTAKFVVK